MFQLKEFWKDVGYFGIYTEFQEELWFSSSIDIITVDN